MEDPQLFVCFLARGSNINHRDQLGHTALFAAIQNMHPGSVRVLLARGADTRRQDKWGDTVLHCCVSPSPRKRDGSLLRLLSTQLQDHLEMTDSDGATALHRVASNCNHEFVAMLLDKGADPNARDSQGMTTLHYAVRNYRDQDPKSVISALAQRGADIHAMLQSGQTVLAAAKRGLRGNVHRKGTVWYIKILESADDVKATHLHGGILSRLDADNSDDKSSDSESDDESGEESDSEESSSSEDEEFVDAQSEHDESA
ncbi:ankyrin repeat-containing domain protein [Aspergillus venezuelensis]